MSVTTITRFHAAEGQEATLLELQSEGRRRMLAAEGCESSSSFMIRGISDLLPFSKLGHRAKHTMPHLASGSWQAVIWRRSSPPSTKESARSSTTWFPSFGPSAPDRWDGEAVRQDRTHPAEGQPMFAEDVCRAD
jgi:hypothetical protein